MTLPRKDIADPIGWCALIALGFLALSWHRLGLPSKPYFDETHYVPAARSLLSLVPANREHPLLGKELIAASIALFGDRPMAWRLPASVMGAFGLFAFGRLIWWSTQRRFAALAGMALLATSCSWFVHSRIGMLDIFAASLALIALWQFAAALVQPGSAPRWRLALCGISLGLAMGAKWTAVPIAVLPGLTFAALKLFSPASRKAVHGIPLLEAAVWLGLLPLAVYWATYIPAFLYAPGDHPVDPLGFIGQHRAMIALQESVTTTHPYQSTWRDWLINRRPIWYLYEHVDGAQRGILLIGNPFAMLAGLPAFACCLWSGLRHGRPASIAFALLFLASLALWLMPTKPVQFYYLYLLPGTFLTGCLALALDAVWCRAGAWRALPIGAIALSAGLFAWFYPILSAAVLHDGPQAFAKWMWLESWR